MKHLPMTANAKTLPESFKKELEQAKYFYNHQHAASTLRAYRSDWSIFERWCHARSLQPLPAAPEVIAVFLSSQASYGSKPATLGRRVAAIRYFHQMAGMNESPTASEIVRSTIKGIKRALGTARAQKAPLTTDRLVKTLEQVPDTLQGCRDQAILLLGFAGAFRRSELAQLLVSDLEVVSAGVRVHIRKSKTDQEGAGQVVPIVKGEHFCPINAVTIWLEKANIHNGPIFRRLGKGGKIFKKSLTPYSIGKIVKYYAEKAGFNPGEYGGHSLRAGFLTSAAMNGASLFKMMDISRHKSMDTLKGYVRLAEEFKDHAGVGLL